MSASTSCTPSPSAPRSSSPPTWTWPWALPTVQPAPWLHCGRLVAAAGPRCVRAHPHLCSSYCPNHTSESHAVTFPVQGAPLMQIDVQLAGSEEVVAVRRTRVRHKYHEALAFGKRTFSLILGYAMTVHRCQGATIDSRVVVHIGSAFAPGLMYVVLSRVTDRRHLHIVGKLLAEDFVPASFPNM